MNARSAATLRTRGSKSPGANPTATFRAASVTSTPDEYGKAPPGHVAAGQARRYLSHFGSFWRQLDIALCRSVVDAKGLDPALEDLTNSRHGGGVQIRRHRVPHLHKVRLEPDMSVRHTAHRNVATVDDRI